jgi:hypothetical protein
MLALKLCLAVWLRLVHIAVFPSAVVDLCSAERDHMSRSTVLSALNTDRLSTEPSAVDLRLSHLVVDIVAGAVAKCRFSSEHLRGPLYPLVMNGI